MSFNDKSLRPHCRGIPPKQAKQAPFLVVVGGRGWAHSQVSWKYHHEFGMLSHDLPMKNLVKSIHFLMKSFFDMWILILFLDSIPTVGYINLHSSRLGHFHRSQLQNPIFGIPLYWKSSSPLHQVLVATAKKSGPLGPKKCTAPPWEWWGLNLPGRYDSQACPHTFAIGCDSQEGELGAGRFFLGSFTAKKSGWGLAMNNKNG